MAKKVRDAMTPNPLEVQASATLTEAAVAMKGADVGAILVLEGSTLRGMLTDRDITIRAIAESKDPATTKVSEIISKELVTVAPDDDMDKAVTLAREKALRRFPVVEGDTAVGIISLGDLALAKDPESALAAISNAPPNG